METEYLTQEAKRTLENVRRKLDFCEPPDQLAKFKCQHCNSIAIMERIAECRHLFCDKCLHKILKRPCPARGCDNTCIEMCTQDKNYESEVANLKVYCPFRSYGCQEVVKLAQYFDHQSKCPYLQDALLSKPFARQTSVNYSTQSSVNRMLDEDYSGLKTSLAEMAEKIKMQEEKINVLEGRLTADQLVPEGQAQKGTSSSSSEEEISKHQLEDVKKIVEMTITNNVLPLKDQLGDTMETKLQEVKAEIITEVQSLIYKEIEAALGKKGPEDEDASAKLEVNKSLESAILEKVTNCLEEKFSETHKEFDQKIHLLKESNEQLQNDLKKILKLTKEYAEEKEDLKGNQISRSGANTESSAIDVSNDSSEFLWKIGQFDQVLESLESGHNGLESDCFDLKGFKSRMKAQLKCHEDHLSIYLTFVDDNNQESSERPIYYHRRTFVVVDQNDDGTVKNDIVRVCEPSFGSYIAEQWMTNYWGSLKFVSLSLLRSKDKPSSSSAMFVKNGTVIIRILIEPMTSLYKHATFKDGVFLWKLDNYRRRKQDEICGLSQGIKSEAFYTSPHGYRMQFEICLNGYGEENRGKYISAFLWFRRGDWDEFLSTSFHHEVKIVICDQSNNEEKSHLCVTYKYNHVFNRSYSKLVLQSDIDNSSYLKNDTLLIKVSITPDQFKGRSNDELGKDLVITGC